MEISGLIDPVNATDEGVRITPGALPAGSRRACGRKKLPLWIKGEGLLKGTRGDVKIA